MKKIFALFLALNFIFCATPVFALSEENSTHLRDMRVQPQNPSYAPQWTDYVPEKYQNPRTDFNRGPAIAELSVGILKNISYADKKEKFFEGLEEIENLPTPEQGLEYKKLLKKCKMKKKIKKKNKKNQDI